MANGLPVENRSGAVRRPPFAVKFNNSVGICLWLVFIPVRVRLQIAGIPSADAVASTPLELLSFSIGYFSVDWSIIYLLNFLFLAWFSVYSLHSGTQVYRCYTHTRGRILKSIAKKTKLQTIQSRKNNNKKTGEEMRINKKMTNWTPNNLQPISIHQVRCFTYTQYFFIYINSK